MLAAVAGKRVGAGGVTPVVSGGGGGFDPFATTNEPEGYTEIVSLPLSSRSDLSGWLAGGGAGSDAGEAESGLRFVADADDPAGLAMQWQYATDLTGGDGIGSYELTGLNLEALYVRAVLKHSDPFDQHGSGVNKIFFIGTNAGGADNEVFMNWRSEAIGYDIVLQGGQPATVDGDALNGQRKCPDYEDRAYEVENSVPTYTYDVAHSFEFVLTRSTGGNPNGTLQIWQDGVRKTNLTNITLNTVGDAIIDALKIDPIWGGTGEAPAQFQWLRFLDLYVSGVPL